MGSCGDTCVSKDDVCCENVLGNSFPCQGNGGGCCGNTCAAPGSKCCKPEGPESAWYPVSKETECRKPSVQCTNRDGTRFECAAGDKCCGGACVGKHDVCCENVNGDDFPCQGEGGGCCGNACYAPGSKCCKPAGPKSAWYPVSKDTECRRASVQCTNRNGDEFECAAGDQCCGDTCVSKDDVCCENLGEQFPMPGEWWWLLRKCMLRTRQQVLQVTLGGESQVVPSHQGHQVRLVSMGSEERSNVL